MVVPWIWVPIPKTQVNWPNAKKSVFCHFLLSLCKKISNGRQSDNFDPRTSAYGPYESLCPKFSKTPLRKSKIFKIEGVMPLQSQVIPICVTQNSCFFGIFWEKMLSHGQTVHFWPHSVIHIQKAVHLRIQKIRLKFDFRHPVERQIFGDGDGLDPALILALCKYDNHFRNETSKRWRDSIGFSINVFCFKIAHYKFFQNTYYELWPSGESRESISSWKSPNLSAPHLKDEKKFWGKKRVFWRFSHCFGSVFGF